MKGISLIIWHRCGIIVGDLQELRLHLEKHIGSKRTTPPLYPQTQSTSTAIPERNRKVQPEQRKVRAES